MTCPRCGQPTKVVDTGQRGALVMRRRKCGICGFVFSTREEYITSEIFYRKSKKGNNNNA